MCGTAIYFQCFLLVLFFHFDTRIKTLFMQKHKTLPKDEEALYLSESSISTMSETSHQSSNCSLPENAGNKNKKTKKIQKLRNFWHQEFQPKLIGDRRATYFLKLFSSNFSLQFYQDTLWLWISNLSWWKRKTSSHQGKHIQINFYRRLA